MNRVDGQRWIPRRRWVLVTAGVVLLAVLALVMTGRPRGTPSPAAQKATPWEPYVPSPAVSIRPAESSGPARPKAPPTVESATPATLSMSTDPVPSTVDLDDEGRRDWVHWGLTTPDGLDRKPGGTAEIKDTGGIGKRGRYENNPELFSWNTVAGTPTGVYSCGAGSAFTLSVPTGPAQRTLRFYAGVWMAEARLTVTTAGRTATTTLANPEGIRTARFTIRFRTPAPGTLRLTWTATKVHHPTCGNIDMQAATLS